MTDYTPEKVAELIADLRARARVAVSHEATDALNAAADTLAAVSAERDEARYWAETMQAQKFGAKARIERDRLHKAITEALAFESVLPAIATEPRRILRTALDKEGDDDE